MVGSVYSWLSMYYAAQDLIFLKCLRDSFYE